MADELRCFWFEIFECGRKIALIGVPVFFAPGTMPQLILGLLICFISFGLYMMFSPYLEDKHDYVSQICQLQIFFALLSGVRRITLIPPDCMCGGLWANKTECLVLSVQWCPVLIRSGCL